MLSAAAHLDIPGGVLATILHTTDGAVARMRVGTEVLGEGDARTSRGELFLHLFRSLDGAMDHVDEASRTWLNGPLPGVGGATDLGPPDRRRHGAGADLSPGQTATGEIGGVIPAGTPRGQDDPTEESDHRSADSALRMCLSYFTSASASIRSREAPSPSSLSLTKSSRTNFSTRLDPAVTT